jgi:rRNA maturation endonuclease Nob1
MFKTTLPHLIIYNLGVLLGLLGMIWVVQVWRQRRRERKALKYKLVCVICGTHFDDFSDEPLVTCPTCGRLNERDRVPDL